MVAVTSSRRGVLAEVIVMMAVAGASPGAITAVVMHVKVAGPVLDCGVDGASGVDDIVAGRGGRTAGSGAVRSIA